MTAASGTADAALAPSLIRATRLGALALVALIALLWWPALSASFQFDDWNVIVDNPNVHSLARWWHTLPGIRPLLKFSYALNWSVLPAPACFRTANIAIHAANTVLAGWLLARRALRAGYNRRVALWAGFASAAIFALHPVQTEAVTYISGRSCSLAALFCLLALYAWVRSEAAATSRGARSWLGCVCVCFAAAVATKETALVLPLAIWLYSADRPARATLRRLLPVLVVGMLMLAAALAVPHYRVLLRVSLETRSISDNLMSQAHALLYLAGQLLRIEHGNADPQLAIVTRLDAYTALLLAGWLVAMVLSLRRVRSSAGAFAVLWFLVWLLPTNSLLPRLDVANDRQLYLPLLGPAWWLALRWSTLREAHPRASAVLAVVMLATLAAATAQRNAVYATELSFWQDTSASNPASARAANNLGMAWALACRDDAAAVQFRRAIELDPQGYRARLNLQWLLAGDLPGRDSASCATSRQGSAAVR